MSNIIKLGNLEIHLDSYRLLRDQQTIRLTPTEWAVLRELVKHPNQVLSHRTLLQRVWGDEYATEFDYVHTYISRLRRKLETNPSNPEYILTESGIGYRFNAEGLIKTQATSHANDLVLHNPLQERRRFINPLPQHVDTRYIGREEQRKQVEQLLLGDTRLVSIYGRAGVGKTGLACKVIYDLQRTNAFDGMVFLSATSTGISLGRIMNDFNRLLETDSQIHAPENQNTLYRITNLLDQLRTGRYLLLLDNLEHIQNPVTHHLTDEDIKAFFQIALSQGSTLSLIITSRYPLNLPRNIKIWERVISLEMGLSANEGVQFLRSSDPDGTAGLRDADDTLLQQIVERTHGLPRALEATIGLLLESPLTSPPDLLEDPTLLSVELGDMFIQGVIDTLQPDAIQMLELVSMFERAVPLRILEKFAQPHLTTSVKPILNRLIRAYFLSYNPDDQTVTMHPIDQQYCYNRIPEPQRIQYHKEIAALYGEEFAPDGQHTLRSDITLAMRSFSHHARSQEFDIAAKTLLHLDDTYLRIWGNYAELAENYSRIVDGISESPLKYDVMLHYGESLRRIGRLNEAIYQFESVRTRNPDNQLQRAHALSGLGWSHYDTGTFPSAISYWEQALTIYRDIGDAYGEGDLLGGLGWVSYLMGAYEQALGYIQSAFRIFGELGDQLYRIGMNIGDSGVIRTAQGDYPQAIKNLRESLSIAEVTRSISEKSYKGGYLATALMLNGENEAARQAAYTAVQYDVPANRHTASVIHGVTLTRLHQRDAAISAFENAITYADHVLTLTQGLYNARYARALALTGLAMLRDNSYDQAIEDYSRAKSLCATKGVIQSQKRFLDLLFNGQPPHHASTIYRLLSD